MITIQLATAFFITFVSKSSASIGSPLENCTELNCLPPFKYCDSLTGACQVTSRYDSSTNYNKYWLEDKFQLNPFFDKFTDVVCSEDGNYPSHDCWYFHQCVDGTSVLKSCDSPGFPYFDPVLERCASSSTCPSIRCFERYDVRVGLEGQLSSFFVYCLAPRLYGSVVGLNYGLKNYFTPYVLTRCYGKDIFNVNTGRCEPRCLQEGLLPDTSDCHHYFLCQLEDPINSVYTMVLLSCPKGQAFLSKGHRCVSEGHVSTCTTPRARPL